MSHASCLSFLDTSPFFLYISFRLFCFFLFLILESALLLFLYALFPLAQFPLTLQIHMDPTVWATTYEAHYIPPNQMIHGFIYSAFGNVR